MAAANELPLPTSQQVEQYNRNSREAAWLFFTTLILKGQQFNLTVREGADVRAVETAMELMAVVQTNMKELGFEMPGVFVQPVSTPAPPANGKPPVRPVDSGPKGSKDRPKDDEEAGRIHIVKIKITGDFEKPKVEMFTANDKLKHPVIYGPSSLVVEMIVKRYPQMAEQENMKMLAQCGRTIAPVDWSIDWVRSDNTTSSGKRYLNFKDIIIWNAEK